MNATNDRTTVGTLHVPLARVALCLDCETCFEIGGDACCFSSRPRRSC